MQTLVNIFKFERTFPICVAISLAIPIIHLHAQQSVSADQIHKFLRQPNGLEKLSNTVGDISLSDDDEMWGSHSIESLYAQSDLIIFGRLNEKASVLSSDGDSILTSFTVLGPDVWKGSNTQSVRFVVGGGSLKLSNGHIATVHTTVWDAVKLSGLYVFFLKKNGNSFVLTGASQSVFEINEKDNSVSLIGSTARLNPALANSVSKSHWPNLRNYFEAKNR